MLVWASREYHRSIPRAEKALGWIFQNFLLSPYWIMDKIHAKMGQKWAFSAVRIKANRHSEFDCAKTSNCTITCLVLKWAEIIGKYSTTTPMMIDWLLSELLRVKWLSELNFYTVIYNVYDLYITPLPYWLFWFKCKGKIKPCPFEYGIFLSRSKLNFIYIIWVKMFSHIQFYFSINYNLFLS